MIGQFLTGKQIHKLVKAGVTVLVKDDMSLPHVDPLRTFERWVHVGDTTKDKDGSYGGDPGQVHLHGDLLGMSVGFDEAVQAIVGGVA
jgi:hypothetical protein